MSNKTGREACNKKSVGKMANPRISKSKEHRGRGPIGLYMRYSEAAKVVHPAGWVDRNYCIAHQQHMITRAEARAAARAWSIMISKTNMDIEQHFLSLEA